MINWIDTHGVYSMLIFAGIALLAGTVPPLPPNSSFLATWAYFALKALSLNIRGIGNSIGVKMPELQIANLPLGMKKEQAAKE